MVFKSPNWVPSLPTPPDSVPVSEFVLNEKYGRRSLNDSRDTYTCGISGRSHSASQVRRRRDNLAKSLRQELGWEVNSGSEYDKVATIFCPNTIDLMTISWAVHQLNGISSPANAAYSVSELAFQLKHSKSKCIFTCESLLQTASEAAKLANLPKNRIFVCQVPGVDSPKGQDTSAHKNLEDLISRGETLPELELQKWKKGQGKTQVAFICYSSGTSGLPKGVLISHYNIISNVLQRAVYEKPWREKHTNNATEVVMGFLPFSHIYGLVLICHTSTYRGDQVIVLPKFELTNFLRCIEKYRIFEIFVVPPIVVIMANALDQLKKYDLSSVRFLYSGAAPLGKEVIELLRSVYKDWNVCQAYGLTESATVVTSSARSDIWLGSSGSLIPGAEVRIVSVDGKEIETYDTPGEVWIKAPSVVLGYLDNVKSTEETFVEDASGRWLKSGDEGEIRVCPDSGNEHLWIVDRIKELIKVNGNQVAPAELEAHLLSHPLVADCAVISIPDAFTGEAPKAYIVKAHKLTADQDEETTKQVIMDFVKKYKTKYKWLKEIAFIEAVPKSPSGKILRRLLRDADRAERKKDRISARL